MYIGVVYNISIMLFAPSQDGLFMAQVSQKCLEILDLVSKSPITKMILDFDVVKLSWDQSHRIALCGKDRTLVVLYNGSISKTMLACPRMTRFEWISTEDFGAMVIFSAHLKEASLWTSRGISFRLLYPTVAFQYSHALDMYVALSRAECKDILTFVGSSQSFQYSLSTKRSTSLSCCLDKPLVCIAAENGVFVHDQDSVLAHLSDIYVEEVYWLSSDLILCLSCFQLLMVSPSLVIMSEIDLSEATWYSQETGYRRCCPTKVSCAPISISCSDTRDHFAITQGTSVYVVNSFGRILCALQHREPPKVSWYQDSLLIISQRIGIWTKDGPEVLEVGPCASASLVRGALVHWTNTEYGVVTLATNTTKGKRRNCDCSEAAIDELDFFRSPVDLGQPETSGIAGSRLKLNSLTRLHSPRADIGFADPIGSEEPCLENRLQRPQKRPKLSMTSTPKLLPRRDQYWNARSPSLGRQTPQFSFDLKSPMSDISPALFSTPVLHERNPLCSPSPMRAAEVSDSASKVRMDLDEIFANATSTPTRILSPVVVHPFDKLKRPISSREDTFAYKRINYNKF